MVISVRGNSEIVNSTMQRKDAQERRKISFVAQCSDKYVHFICGFAESQGSGDR